MILPNKVQEERVKEAFKILEDCTLCPRSCRVNRLNDERGYCAMGRDLEVASYGAHYGEEDVLAGSGGSGTIFLNSCNLSCVFCQNYDISQLRNGWVVSQDEFVQMMLSLQERGCHNINFVTPTHFMPQILKAVLTAQGKGLCVPLVYNCGGYESLRSLQLLEGIIDIFMPDMKYLDEETAHRLSNAPNYPNIAKIALKEMYRQVGDLVIDERGVAIKGMLIRHLVLSDNLAQTGQILRFIAQEVSLNSYVNIMDQYRPCYNAQHFLHLTRPITQQEYIQATNEARKLGLHRGF